MLRALGIVFIIGTVMFGGLFVVGLGWWAIASGTVQITGINDNRPITGAVRPSRQRLHDRSKTTPAEYGGQAALKPAILVKPPGVPVHTASYSSPVSIALSPASIIFPPVSQLPDSFSNSDAIDPKIEAALTDLTLVRITAVGSSNPMSWAPSLKNPVLFPSDTTEIHLFYSGSAADNIQELQKAVQTAFTNGQRAKLGVVVLGIDAFESSEVVAENGNHPTLLQIKYKSLTKGIPLTVGLTAAVSAKGRSNIFVTGNSGGIRRPRVLNTYNGRYQPDTEPLRNANGSTPNMDPALYGPYFRMNFTAQVPSSEIQFLLMKKTTDGSSAVEQLETTEIINAVPQSIGTNSFVVTFDQSVQFSNLSVDDTGILWIAAKSGNSYLLSDPITLTRRVTNVAALAAISIKSPTNNSTISANAVLNVDLGSISSMPDLDLMVTTADGVKSYRITNINGTVYHTQPSTGGLTLANLRSLEVPVEFKTDGKQVLTASLFRGNSPVSSAIQGPNATSATVTVDVLRRGPSITNIDSSRFVNTPNDNVMILQFDRSHQLVKAGATEKTNYRIETPSGGSQTPPDAVIFDATNNRVTLTFPDNVFPGQWRLVVSALNSDQAQMLEDAAGNALNSTPENSPGKDHVLLVQRSALGEVPLTQRGIGSAGTGKHVEFPEYTKPRKYPSGFNPSDKVVTRVARLYYFRDAHRVTQIINRQAKSYNRQAVDMKQQFADAARRDADQATATRQENEQKAIRAAQEARAAENALEEHQQALIQARTELGQLRSLVNELDDDIAEKEQTIADAPDPTTDEIKKLKRQLSDRKRDRRRFQTRQNQAQLDVDQEESAVRLLLSTVQSARSTEISATERWEADEQTERLKAEEQFRREVAAKTEDPDTYVPGDPRSDDPVTQVSLSVVGEGLIQLRGPRKGVNEVHKMINQLDAPVGQVKIALHTVQVNGEGGNRMEQVVMRIQRYLDHSRFLTVQSGQMLRNAVVSVASRRAAMIADTCPPGTPQQLRDYKYQEAFFGQDFVQELRSMDSEFLRTGNKVLSLHSMDTTSLSNALFLMSLAKNDIRVEILDEFMASVQCKLPQDEQEFFVESGAEFKFRHKEFQFLGQNARFVALRGFFDAQVTGTDTLNPMQREFIRLAQIFKARLVTEIELRQRVMERALIEERIGAPEQYQQLQVDAKTAEDEANAEVRKFRKQVRSDLGQFLSVVADLTLDLKRRQDLITSMGRKRDEMADDTISALGEYNHQYIDGDNLVERIKRIQNELFVDPAIEGIHGNPAIAEMPFDERWEVYKVRVNKELTKQLNDDDWKKWLRVFEDEVLSSDSATDAAAALLDLRTQLADIQRVFDLTKQFDGYSTAAAEILAEDMRATPVKQLDQLNRAALFLQPVQRRVVATLTEALEDLTQLSDSFQSALTSRDGLDRIPSLVAQWEAAYKRFKPFINSSEEFSNKLAVASTRFTSLKRNHALFTAAIAEADELRRPLDHKKFLDMLIDDVEEKFIELVEGTRAQTSNIDNYLKRLGTALEDDFNAQFYHPAFRYVRETSYFYDVSVGQVETTSVVANNRMFAKVSPQATMEFDLPKRDILINEAMNSAMAAYNDYGALMGDPNFLSLMKLYGGQPTSSTFGQQFGSPYVQEVLPGLPSTTDAQFLTSARNNVPRIGSSLEALIPDPAIYKFETGTGYEIRPVIQPDGQSVVFHLDYMYTTNVREPVRADEKHLGRVKRHFINTDVVSGNYELREVSTYRVGLKASRTSRGIPLLEDVPGLGVLFRPQASAESSLQQNIILTQSVIYPTLFDLMGLRWAPAVADLDSLSLQEREFVTRNREKALRNEVFDYSSLQVDEFLRIPDAERRGDLYRVQETIPRIHPNGYNGRGLNIRNGQLREGYSPEQFHPQSRFVPRRSEDARFSLEESPKQPVYADPGFLIPEGATPVENFPSQIEIPVQETSVIPMSYHSDASLAQSGTVSAMPTKLQELKKEAAESGLRRGNSDSTGSKFHTNPVGQPKSGTRKNLSASQPRSRHRSRFGRQETLKRPNRASRFLNSLFRK